MTIDYTKISEQMNQSPQVIKPQRGKKDFINPARPGAESKLGNKLKIFLVIIASIASLIYAPPLFIFAAIFIAKNKKANQAFKNFIKGADTTSLLGRIVSKLSQHIPSDHQDELKKKLAEYNLKPSDDEEHNKDTIHHPAPVLGPLSRGQ